MVSLSLFRRRIPLAWLQLTREKIRLLVALAGISFSGILMFMQLGFQDGLFESAIRFHVALQGDIFLVSPQSNALIAMDNFSQRRLFQALNVEGVREISPIYLSFALWKNPENGRTRGIFVIGIDPDANVLALPGLTPENLARIKQDDVVLFDRDSRAEFGAVAAWMEQGRTVSTEVGSHRITVGGLFQMGATFGADGSIIVSERTFLNIFNQRRRGIIEAGLIRLEPGVDPDPVIARLKTMMGSDLLVLSKAEFVEFERRYWAESTAIGFIFSLGTIMGFVVGIIIVYQILYTDVSDHLAEYATLKAMGYTDLYLLGVVFQEAITLAILGYIPAFSLAVLLYDLTRRSTLLPISMTTERAVLIFVLIVVMCFISGGIAVRRLRAAD
ncbi:MAG: ABC transporter permease DevC, partial [Thermostichales cyanobacterium SRBZ-1_bins_19]